MKLLVNAEAFGFGPTAAAASFAFGLRSRVSVLGYAGTGHTLDLQSTVAYDHIHRMDGADPQSWHTVMSQYDGMLTTTDIGIAEMALDAGMRVAFYDPLSWYWRQLPDLVRHDPWQCLYVAQDFIGVRERLEREAPHAVIVPPIVERHRRQRQRQRTQDMVLLCLGGLHNPMWDARAADFYAMAAIRAVRAALPAGMTLEVAASSSVVRSCGMPEVRVRNAAEMMSLMSQARFALMTPGLGNIYDAASWDIPVAWLPPANGSQACQLELVAAEGMADVAIGWNRHGVAMDCHGSQAAFMAAVSRATAGLQTARGARMLGTDVADAIGALLAGRGGGLGQILVRFGSGGAGKVVDSVVAWLEQPRSTQQ